MNGKNIEEAKKSLKKVSKSLFKWFADNQMKSNTNKCHCEKLLGVKFNYKLTFDDQT